MEQCYAGREGSGHASCSTVPRFPYLRGLLADAENEPRVIGRCCEASARASRRHNRGTRAIMTALDPARPENAAEAPLPKWTSERVAFITEQYLNYRKSGGEIARMLGPAFTRNSVTGKLFRTGALKARSGMGLRSDHGLPRGANFGNPGSGSRKTREDAKPPASAKQRVEELPQAEPGGADF